MTLGEPLSPQETGPSTETAAAWRTLNVGLQAPSSRLFSPAGFRYITYHVYNCSQKTLTSPFSGPVDLNSLFVENDYIFFTVPLLLGSRKLAQGDVEPGPFHGK